MAQQINHFNHTTKTPPFYQRRYDHDLPKVEGEPDWQALTKRVMLLTLPFISMYRPIGSAISLTMGATRCATHLNEAANAKSESLKAPVELLQSMLAIYALAATLLSSTLGLLVTSGADTLISAGSVCGHLSKGEYVLAGEESLQTVGSALYMGTMVSGSLEIVLVSTLLQAAICLYQARREFSEGRYPEAVAKMVMGSVRLYQAKNTVHLIQKRNYFLTVQKFTDLMARAKKGSEIRHLIDSPLVDLKKKIEERQTGLGSNFHGFGKELVKGDNLSFRTKVVDGKEVTELDFKVNHVFRDKIQVLLNELQGMKQNEIQKILSISGSHAKGIKVEMGSFPIGSLEIGPAYKVSLEGLGSIQIGGSKDFPTLNDRVIVQMDAKRTSSISMRCSHS